jgi:hypothetical protein
MRKTTIYVGDRKGQFHRLIEEDIVRGDRRARSSDKWFFPEIDYGCRGGPIARHPARIVELAPEMVGKTIVTMSEHIVLAFQQMLRRMELDWRDLELYCGNMQIKMDTDGDMEYWPGGFFTERLELLR